MRFVDGKPEFPEQDPFLPINRSVAAHRSLVEKESLENRWIVKLYFPDVETEEIRVSVTDQNLLICAETDPPIQEIVEAPRVLDPESLQIDRQGDIIKLELNFRPQLNTPPSLNRAPCVEHPRCNCQENEERKIAIT